MLLEHGEFIFFENFFNYVDVTRRFGHGQGYSMDIGMDMDSGSIAEPEPPEPYHFNPISTGTVSLL
jgi:hypothetical protein